MRMGRVRTRKKIGRATGRRMRRGMGKEEAGLLPLFVLHRLGPRVAPLRLVEVVGRVVEGGITEE
jgi:hypothetical protein